jgi:hypothetical protein
MSKSTIHLDYAPPGWRGRLDMFLTEQGQGFNAHVLSQSRLHDLLALERLSDGELDRIGLKRADIPAFVFADLFGCDGPGTSGNA